MWVVAVLFKQMNQFCILRNNLCKRVASSSPFLSIVLSMAILGSFSTVTICFFTLSILQLSLPLEMKSHNSLSTNSSVYPKDNANSSRVTLLKGVKYCR